MGYGTYICTYIRARGNRSQESYSKRNIEVLRRKVMKSYEIVKGGERGVVVKRSWVWRNCRVERILGVAQPDASFFLPEFHKTLLKCWL